MITNNEISILGLFSIKLYSIAIFAAILCGVLLFSYLSKQDKRLKKVDVWEGALCVILPAIVGARIYHVITDFYLYENNLLGVFELWNGGLGIVGGIIGGAIGGWYYARRKRIPVEPALGLLAVVVPFGQAIGRLGNFFNKELFGLPVDSSFPLAFYLPAEENKIAALREFEYFHPLFLYEAVGTFSLFLLLFAMWKRKVRGGQLVKVYFAGYMVIRFLLDFLRVEGNSGYWIFTYAQWLILVLLFLALVVGCVYQIWFRRKNGIWFTQIT